MYAHWDGTVRDDGTQLFPCTLRDELSFSRSVGEPIIIANTDPRLSPGYVALASLSGFDRSPDGETRAVLTDISIFPDTVALLDEVPGTAHISRLRDGQYERIISSVVGGLEETTSQDEFHISIDHFTEQLRRQQRHRCSFSGVETHDGAAFMIRPASFGGHWHASNFLFLDPEPGTLFANFAWTVGPNLEILINTHASSPGLAEAVSRTGQLVLHQSLQIPPDRAALAWHRQQFFARFKEEESS